MKISVSQRKALKALKIDWEAAYGDRCWDRLEKILLELGVDAQLAGLARAVMREHYQHDWPERYAPWVSARAAYDMARLAVVDPDYALARWGYLLETDGEWRDRSGNYDPV